MSTKEDPIRMMDWFSGIGGVRLGFESQGAVCVHSAEWNKYARESYCANFEDEQQHQKVLTQYCEQYRGYARLQASGENNTVAQWFEATKALREQHVFDQDITQLNHELLPEVDLLCAGFPCQPFSMAGLKQGFEHPTQGTLFFEIEQFLEKRQPRLIFLENVKNLKSHDKGKTFKVICETLTRLGYGIDDRIVNANHFVPQGRERIFIGGYLKSAWPEGFEWSWDGLKLPAGGEKKLNSILQSEEEAAPYKISEKLWKYLRSHAENHAAKGNGFGYGLVGPEDIARTISARYYKDGSEILIHPTPKVQDLNSICPRKLTPREALRLQGYPDSFKQVVSDTQLYKQVGNSVCTPLIGALAAYMMDTLWEHRLRPEVQKVSKPSVRKRV